MTKREAVDLETGDRLNLAGIICTVTKIEETHYYTDKTRIRLELQMAGLQGAFGKIIMTIPRRISVTIYQGKK